MNEVVMLSITTIRAIEADVGPATWLFARVPTIDDIRDAVTGGPNDFWGTFEEPLRALVNGIPKDWVDGAVVVAGGGGGDKVLLSLSLQPVHGAL